MRWVLVAVVVLFFASAPAGSRAAEIVIAGTGDSQLLLQALAGDYEKTHPGIRVVIPPSIGSSGGVRAVASGKYALGRIARPLLAQEAQLGLSYKIFGYSPVVFIVNKSVTGVESLSGEQVRAIFSGEITNWSVLGGPDAKIYLVNREVGDSSRLVLERELPGFAGIGKLPGPVFYSTPEAMLALAEHAFTLGYGPLAMVQGDATRILRYNGVAPADAAGHATSYPLAAPFALVWKGRLDAQQQQFVDFLASRRAGDIMRRYGVRPAID